MTDWSRRGLLRAGLATAAAGGGVTLVSSCGRGSEQNATTTTSPSGLARSDLDLAPLAAELEALAVATYRQVGRAADRLGGIPAYGAELLKTALDHHEAHLARWNELNVGAGFGTVDTAHAGLQPSIQRRVDEARSFREVAGAVAELEQVLAATYLDAVGRTRSREGLTLVGSLHVVELQHAAALSLVNGEFPVPESFAGTQGALRP